MGKFMEEDKSNEKYNFIPLEETPLNERIGIESNENGQYVVLMRRYKQQSRAWTQHSRLKAYISGKRNRLTLREFSGPTWQGVLMLVFGLLLFMFSLLLGQFWEEDRGFHSRQGRKTIITPRGGASTGRQYRQRSTMRPSVQKRKE